MISHIFPDSSILTFTFDNCGILPTETTTQPLPEEKNYMCQLGCGRSYRTYHTMTRHMKFECGTEKMFRCTVCEKRFSHKHHLKNHCVNVRRCRGGDVSCL